jgi:hypothetical protein
MHNLLELEAKHLAKTRDHDTSATLSSRHTPSAIQINPAGE